MRDSCTWVIGGPKTFRLGSRKILKTYGGNCQNIEKGAREVYISDGWEAKDVPKLLYFQDTNDLSVFTEEELNRIKIFVQTDEDGADARIVAYECENGNYRKLFIHGIKSHVYVGMHLFQPVWKKKMRDITGDVPFDLDEVIKTPIQSLKSAPFWKELNGLIKESDDWSISERYYYLAKQTCHSANYDIQAPTFRMNILEKSGGKIIISNDEAERFLIVYRSLFPEIPERNHRVKRQGEMTGMLYNMFGHPYTITSYNRTESTYKEWYSWSPQSTVGVIINVAISCMQEFIEAERRNWDVLINGHDSMVSQVCLKDYIEGATKSREFVEQQFTSPIDGAVFNMKSETKVGFNWAPFHKDKNKLGLREIRF